MLQYNSVTEYVPSPSPLLMSLLAKSRSPQIRVVAWNALRHLVSVQQGEGQNQNGFQQQQQQLMVQSQNGFQLPPLPSPPQPPQQQQVLQSPVQNQQEPQQQQQQAPMISLSPKLQMAANAVVTVLSPPSKTNAPSQWVIPNATDYKLRDYQMLQLTSALKRHEIALQKAMTDAFVSASVLLRDNLPVVVIVVKHANINVQEVIPIDVVLDIPLARIVVEIEKEKGEAKAKDDVVKNEVILPSSLSVTAVLPPPPPSEAPALLPVPLISTTVVATEAKMTTPTKTDNDKTSKPISIWNNNNKTEHLLVRLQHPLLPQKSKQEERSSITTVEDFRQSLHEVQQVVDSKHAYDQRPVIRQQKKASVKRHKANGTLDSANGARQQYEYAQSADVAVFKPSQYFYQQKQHAQQQQPHLLSDRRAISVDRVGAPVLVHESSSSSDSSDDDHDAKNTSNSSSSAHLASSISNSTALTSRKRNKRLKRKLRLKQMALKEPALAAAAGPSPVNTAAPAAVMKSKESVESKKPLTFESPVIDAMAAIRVSAMDHYNRLQKDNFMGNPRNGLVIIPECNSALDVVKSDENFREVYRIAYVFNMLDKQSVKEIESTKFPEMLFKNSKRTPLTTLEKEKLMLFGALWSCISFSHPNWTFGNVKMIYFSIPWVACSSSLSSSLKTTGAQNDDSRVKQHRERLRKQLKVARENGSGFDSLVVQMHPIDSLTCSCKRIMKQCPRCAYPHCSSCNPEHSDEFCKWMVEQCYSSEFFLVNDCTQKACPAIIGGPLRSCVRCSSLVSPAQIIQRVQCERCNIVTYCSKACKDNDLDENIGFHTSHECKSFRELRTAMETSMHPFFAGATNKSIVTRLEANARREMMVSVAGLSVPVGTTAAKHSQVQAGLVRTGLLFQTALDAPVILDRMHQLMMDVNERKIPVLAADEDQAISKHAEHLINPRVAKHIMNYMNRLTQHEQNTASAALESDGDGVDKKDVADDNKDADDDADDDEQWADAPSPMKPLVVNDTF